MSQWFYCKDVLPPMGKQVLVFTGDSSYPYEIMSYYGIHKEEYICYRNGIRTIETVFHDTWWDNNGGCRNENPVAWQFIDESIEEGKQWVEGRVL